MHRPPKLTHNGACCALGYGCTHSVRSAMSAPTVWAQLCRHPQCGLSYGGTHSVGSAMDAPTVWAQLCGHPQCALSYGCTHSVRSALQAPIVCALLCGSGPSTGIVHLHCTMKESSIAQKD